MGRGGEGGGGQGEKNAQRWPRITLPHDFLANVVRLPHGPVALVALGREFVQDGAPVAGDGGILDRFGPLRGRARNHGLWDARQDVYTMPQVDQEVVCSWLGRH